jgi:hypothetical protein
MAFVPLDNPFKLTVANLPKPATQNSSFLRPASLLVPAKIRLSDLVFQEAQSVIGQAGLTRLSVGNLGFKESLKIGQCPIEFFLDTHHDACLLYALDRPFKDVNFASHFQKQSCGYFVPAEPTFSH